MSFRNTFVTEYLYRHGKESELNAIQTELDRFGIVEWSGSPNNRQYGYFHGVFKDADPTFVKRNESEIVNALSKLGVRLKIVHEYDKE